MSSTNHTTNYGLSQFLGTDKPAWLVDYNGDMAAIDTQMKANADAASGAQTTANTADGKADANASAITTLDTQINGASGIASDVTTLQGSVNTITSLIGNGEPTTTDKTLIGAINEINSNISTNIANYSGGTFTHKGLSATIIKVGRIVEVSIYGTATEEISANESMFTSAGEGIRGAIDFNASAYGINDLLILQAKASAGAIVASNRAIAVDETPRICFTYIAHDTTPIATV